MASTDMRKHVRDAHRDAERTFRRDRDNSARPATPVTPDADTPSHDPKAPNGVRIPRGSQHKP